MGSGSVVSGSSDMVCMDLSSELHGIRTGS